MQDELLVIINSTWLDEQRLRPLTGEQAGVGSSPLTFFWIIESAQGILHERPRLTTQESMETAEGRLGNSEKNKQAAALFFFCCLLGPHWICATCLAFED
jgi:hypothetical protein